MTDILIILLIISYKKLIYPPKLIVFLLCYNSKFESENKFLQFPEKLNNYHIHYTAMK